MFALMGTRVESCDGLLDEPSTEEMRAMAAEVEAAPLSADELLDLACAPWASLAELRTERPGGDLASVLELLDPAVLDDTLLVEAVAAAERLAAWAHLTAAVTAAELSRRASMNPDWDLPLPARTCVAGDELAMRLGWSRPAANRLVRDGKALEAELMPVADAVRAGLLDTAKMRVLTDRLSDRAYQLTWPALEQVLPQAPLRTPSQLAADIDRALLASDPQDAAFRLPAALARRHVCHPRRLPDGMAGIWAVLPATDAARIDGTLEATARTARALGDTRTLDQLRADSPPPWPAAPRCSRAQSTHLPAAPAAAQPARASSPTDPARAGPAAARRDHPVARRHASASPRCASTSPWRCPPCWDWMTSPASWQAWDRSPPSRRGPWQWAEPGDGSSPIR